MGEGLHSLLGQLAAQSLPAFCVQAHRSPHMYKLEPSISMCASITCILWWSLIGLEVRLAASPAIASLYSDQAPFISLLGTVLLLSCPWPDECCWSETVSTHPCTLSQRPFSLGTAACGCPLLNEHAAKWSCEELKGLSASAVTLAEFCQQFATSDSVWNTCCSPGSIEVHLKM